MKVTIINDEDWQGLYLDGKLVLQDHRLENQDVLKALGIAFEKIEPDSEWLGTVGHFPEDLKDVKLRKVKKATKPKNKKSG